MKTRNKQRRFNRTKSFFGGVASGTGGLLLVGAAAGGASDAANAHALIKVNRKLFQQHPDPYVHLTPYGKSLKHQIRRSTSLRRGGIAAAAVLGTVGATALVDSGRKMKAAFKRKKAK